MWNGRDNQNGEIREGEGVVAVAVDKEKSSQFAIKWAVDNLFPRTTPLKLIHVVHQRLPPSNPGAAGNSDIVAQHEPDTQGMEVLLPYRCFCTRRKVPFETVILHNSDVARALIDYISSGGVSTLILGTLSRNGISRIFKNSDVSNSVLKRAPNSCNVYIISKGKVSAMRPASRSTQAIHAVERAQPIYSNVNHHADPDMLYDELSVVENENSIARLSIDSDFVSFYENLESGLVRSSSDILNSDNGNFEPLFSSSKSVKVDTMKDYSCSEGPLFSLEDVEDEVRRHKLELKKAMDMYHVACREAQVSTQKLVELRDWNMKQEQRLKEAESEIARCKAAIEAEKMLAEKEMKNRVLKAEIKAMIEADERKKVFDAFRQSQTVIKYQTLFHALVVIFLFYLYFSSF